MSAVTTPMSPWKTHGHLLPGGGALALAAGYINAVVLGFFHTPVSHMSGAVSHLGLDLAYHRVGASLTNFGIIVGFLLGACIAGLVVGSHQIRPARRYGVALIAEGLLLALATWLLLGRHALGAPMAAAACGLQNGVSTTYFGLALRTTHVTGMVTDLGLFCGHWLRHGRVDRRKLQVSIALFLAFGLGGFIGAWLDLHHGAIALSVPALSVAVGGAIFFIWAQRQRRNPTPLPCG
jgi:uncharacterized membrane protein YoaK (UPF0700 family)